MIANRQERFEARITADQRGLIARAATLEGLSTSSFVVQRALASAAQTVEQHEVVRLSEYDSRCIAEALIDPPEPTEVVRQYRQSMSG